jgi:hypothetical protein
MFKTIYLFGLILSTVYSSNIYSQCVSGDCQNGEGTYSYGNAVYWGNWKDGKREGYGVLIMNDKSSLYKGNWSNDKRNGFGSFYWSSGDVYEGNWIDDDRSGQATFYWSNGDRFVGKFFNGQTTENGITTRKAIKKLCISGDCNNGYGKFGFANAVYEGYFKNGKREGKGKTIAWDGGTYEGEYLNDLPNGKGKYTFSNGTVYEGYWVNGNKSGQGIIIWGKGNNEGDKYEGAWYEDERTGKGKYTWVNGDVYDGDFINGKRTGNGILIWGKGNNEGDKYEGAWYDNKRTGFGKYTNVRTGEIKEGNFVDGVFQGSQSIAQSEIPKIQRLSSGNSSTVTETSDKSSQNCTYKFTKPTNLTYKYIDNRKTCCYCRERYAIYELTTNVVNAEQAMYLTEKLYSHFESENVDSEHKEYDLERLSKFLQTTYPGYENLGIVMTPILMEYLIPMYSLSGRKLGSTVRETDKYTIKSKFCSPKCENDCKYYGCSSCNY